jgi:hypothetical protein
LANCRDQFPNTVAPGVDALNELGQSVRLDPFRWDVSRDFTEREQTKRGAVRLRGPKANLWASAEPGIQVLRDQVSCLPDRQLLWISCARSRDRSTDRTVCMTRLCGSSRCISHWRLGNFDLGLALLVIGLRPAPFRAGAFRSGAIGSILDCANSDTQLSCGSVLC